MYWTHRCNGLLHWQLCVALRTYTENDANRPNALLCCFTCVKLMGLHCL